MTKYTKFFKTSSGKIVGLTVLLFVALFAYYSYAVSSGSVKTDTGTVTKEVSLEDHTRGAKAATVSIIEYGDFQCPACKAYETSVQALLAKHTDDVRLTFRHFPLMQIHKNAFMAATYAEAAGMQGKFWEMHDTLYEKQEEWGEALDAETKVQGYAASLGLDMAQVKSAVSSKDVQDKILSQFKEASLLKLPGTPSFFVNGKKVESKDLEKEVESALAESKK